MAESLVAAVLLSTDKDVAEISELARSAGYRIIKTYIQKRKHPHPELYIGEGKAKQVKEYISTGRALTGDEVSTCDDDIEEDEEYESEVKWEKPGMVIFNGQLKPGHTFHLENAFGIPVYDRIRLILYIFEKRANSPEARLQVEYAKLNYDVPLVKEYIHRTKTGEHPGLFFAGGSYQVDEYYEMIKSRMAKIRKELERVKGERAQRRKTRRRGGQALISLAGYTNAGKSQLFKSICTEDAVVDDRLFSTLSTTTRVLKMPVQGSRVLMTDTVGFIRKLPVWLVEAFQSTLEEAFLSDAIILVLDLSDDVSEMMSKLETSLGILKNGPKDIPIILALNKSDLVEDVERQLRVDRVLLAQNPQRHCVISALRGDGLQALMDVTLSSLQDFFFGSITGPEPVMRELRHELGIRLEGKKACRVLLRSWEVQGLMKKHTELRFERAGGPGEVTPP